MQIWNSARNNLANNRRLFSVSRVWNSRNLFTLFISRIAITSREIHFAASHVLRINQKTIVSSKVEMKDCFPFFVIFRKNLTLSTNGRLNCQDTSSTLHATSRWLGRFSVALLKRLKEAGWPIGKRAMRAHKCFATIEILSNRASKHASVYKTSMQLPKTLRRLRLKWETI